MAFDFIEFCNDNNIEYVTEGHKHCRSGWVNIECPFCTGNEGYHLGYEISKERFVCWRCKGKRKEDVVSKLIGCTRIEAKDIIRQHRGKVRVRTKDITVMKSRSCKLPIGTGPLQDIHKKYLKKRKFDADYLEKTWGLKGTMGVGPYKFRVIAPILHEGKIVSYQGRDITNKSKLKYKACKSSQEVVDHKHTLYGEHLIRGSILVVCEGITDVWRLGPGAVATFGISYTPHQVNRLRKYSTIFIYFDSADKQAIAQAEILGNTLSVFADVEIITTKWADPGSMPQIEADRLMMDLFPTGGGYLSAPR